MPADDTLCSVSAPDVELTVVVPPITASVVDPVTLTVSSVSTVPPASVIFSTSDASDAAGIDVALVVPSNR